MNPIATFKAQTPTAFRASSTLAGTLIALVAASWVLSPSTDNYLVLAAGATIAIMGLSILTGGSGQVSIGNAGFMAIGAFTTAIIGTHNAHFFIVGSLLAGTAAGAVSGVIIGLPATRLRGPYLAGMTLAFAFVMQPFIQSFGSLTGGSGGLYLNELTTPHWFASLVGDSDNLIAANARYQSALAVLVAGIALFFASNVMSSRLGRAMRLVRDDEVAAELVGVNLAKTRVLAFVISDAFAGLAGSLLTLIAASASPSTYGLALSIELLSLLVLGGMGSISGAIIAGLLSAYSGQLVGKINSLFGVDPYSNVGANTKGIIFGVILIVMMLAAPTGLVGLAKKVTARLRAAADRRSARSLSHG